MNSKSHRHKQNGKKRYQKDVTIQRCLFPQRKHNPRETDLRIASYNILADSLLYNNLYLYVYNSKLPKEKQPYYLAWEYRKELLLQQLVGPRPRTTAPRIFERLHFTDNQLVRPAVLCLQEVDRFEELLEALADYHYAGVFKKRTGARLDGCAIFYQQNKLELLAHHNIEFNRSLPNAQPLLSERLSVVNPIVEKLHHNTPKRVFINLSEDTSRILCTVESEEYNGVDFVLDRDNVAIVGLFRLLHNPTKVICVACTHLLFNPKRGDIKLLQIDLLLHETIAFLQKHNLSPDQTPFVVCGDFNSSYNSSIYEYMKENRVTINPESAFWRHRLSGLCEDVQMKCTYVESIKDLEEKFNFELDGSEEQIIQRYNQIRSENFYLLPEGIKTEVQIFEHPFHFTSSYCVRGKEPFCTTLHRKAKETVDFMFHTNLRQGKILEISHLSKEDLNTRILPNRFHPSDHLMLATEFSL